MPKKKYYPQNEVVTLAAKDKLLQKIQRNDNIYIRVNEVNEEFISVKLKKGTWVLPTPEKVDGAVQRYNQRYRLSQEQSHIHQRKPLPKAKVKQQQSEQYFYN